MLNLYTFLGKCKVAHLILFLFTKKINKKDKKSKKIKKKQDGDPRIEAKIEF